MSHRILGTFRLQAPATRTGAGVRVDGARRAGHAVAALSRVTGRGSGGVIGGRVLLALAPEAPRRLAAGREIALVSGTNGKTTTTAFLSAALGTLGPVDSNTLGANTPAGCTTTLAEGHAPRVVLETDEGWVPWSVERLRPSTALLLNLSRDQLSRHHEVSMLAGAWRRAMAAVGTVVANVDDPDTVWPALAARRQVWVAGGQRWTQDSVACPACGERCRRQDSTWECVCGLRRPEPDWWLEGEELVGRRYRLPLRLAVPGRYNRANAAFAVAAAIELGADPAAAVDRIAGIGSVEGRYSWQDVGDHHVRLLLAKNPAGWLELLDLVRESEAPLVLAFNSDGVDGRDPSWLYDVSFEALAGRDLVVTGRRATDMQVRLEMDGLAPVRVPGGVRAALSVLPPGPVDVLANYTAFQEARRELAHGHER